MLKAERETLNQELMDNIQERRNFPRSSYETKVRCVAINDCDTLNAQLQNISITGMCLLTKEPLKLDSFYELMYYNKENHVKKEVAKVKWYYTSNNNFAKQGLEFWSHHKLQKDKLSS